MSQEQESVLMYLWGFVESRGRKPAVVEAYGDLTETFAIMNSVERAVELGFSARDARDVHSVFEGQDDGGAFELRQFWLEDVELNGTAVLFEEANHLATAVAELLAMWDRFRADEPQVPEPEQAMRVRRALTEYDDRWEIRRDTVGR